MTLCSPDDHERDESARLQKGHAMNGQCKLTGNLLSDKKRVDFVPPTALRFYQSL